MEPPPKANPEQPQPQAQPQQQQQQPPQKGAPSPQAPNDKPADRMEVD